MKRFWTAVILLICIMAGCMYNFHLVSQTVSRISVPLTQAAQAVQSDDLANAGRLTAQAQQIYQQREAYLSAVINEKLLDEVRLDFARTAEGIRAGDTAQCAVELAGLRQAVDDLLRAEIMNEKNIF